MKTREREGPGETEQTMSLTRALVSGRSCGSGVSRAGGRRGTLQVVAATTPQFKSTKHHQRSRPKKTRASDKNRKPTEYEPLPPPPPQFEVVSAAKAKSSDE